MNRTEDSLMILCWTRCFRAEYPAVVCSTRPRDKVEAISPAPATTACTCVRVSFFVVFFPFPHLHQTCFMRWTLEAVCRFYLQLIFGRLGRASSPWIFILPLTPLNVNSSFPVLLFISGTGWFDHAGNTRLAIALSLLSPPCPPSKDICYWNVIVCAS